MEKELELGKIVSVYNLLEGGTDVTNSIKNLSLKFKGKTAFKISLLKSKLREYVTIAEETRSALIKDKYGIPTEEGSIIVPNDKISDFVNEYADILMTKHSITFTPLNTDDLDGIEIPVEFTDTLIDFIEFE